jgi:hypothetical protein
MTAWGQNPKPRRTVARPQPPTADINTVRRADNEAQPLPIGNV